ncbi:hypothetical protein PSHT_05740 [Puccinia striiformis]|uniref:UFSP1/2/DUB catalytic domain-containing protein n=1 Tax=Puccinia striiformis TaxID=27350 RepID=A0A2S4W9M4_9BASI|nr:hypothetical protein PSHT_05740 [Puccinia striiformis]
MQGNYQTDQPTGLGHLPALLARLLEQSYRDQRTRSATLCDKNVVHIGTSVDKSKLGPETGHGDADTGTCRWYSRLSFLGRSSPAIIHALHAPSIAIPSIHLWQSVIQDAWNNGFDPDGAAHFSGHLIGKKQWIGTTEVYVALSRLGLKCQIIDFPKPSAPNGQHIKLIQWVEINRYTLDYFNSTSNLTDNNSTIKPKIEITNRFPLYFQHDGHSRTIIGIEINSDCQTQLLILDPAKRIDLSTNREEESHLSWTGIHQTPSSVRQSLSQKEHVTLNQPSLIYVLILSFWAAHRLTLKELSKKKQYQILCVLDQVPKPADSDPDQHKLHTIRSLRIL